VPIFVERGAPLFIEFSSVSSRLLRKRYRMARPGERPLCAISCPWRARNPNFRFTPESRLNSEIAACPKSARKRLPHCNKARGNSTAAFLRLALANAPPVSSSGAGIVHGIAPLRLPARATGHWIAVTTSAETLLLSFMRAALGTNERQYAPQTVRSRGICAKERRRACQLLRAVSNFPAYELSIANNETSSDLLRTQVFSKIDFR
jgi:hypothetical protein